MVQPLIFAVQPCLKAVAIFPEIVQQTSERRFFSAVPSLQKFSCDL